MSKLIQEKITGQYPGLVRTIQVFDDNIIEIEFNFDYSNEIGIRFRKHFENAAAENKHLQEYMRRTERYELTYQDSIEKTAWRSWERLIIDTINNCVFLPDNGKDYYCMIGKEEELIQWLEHSKKLRSGGS